MKSFLHANAVFEAPWKFYDERCVINGSYDDSAS